MHSHSVAEKRTYAQAPAPPGFVDFLAGPAARAPNPKG